MPLLTPRLSFDEKRIVGYSWWCPACKRLHAFNTDGDQAPLWTFNGNLRSPSFSPSLRYCYGNECHTIVQNGTIYYCTDSKHALAGKTVPMVDFDFERMCPMSTTHTINGKPVEPGPAPVGAVPAPSQTANPAVTEEMWRKQKHSAACGEVGETGAHGDLGSNAA